MHYIVKVFFRGDKKFETVSITYSKKQAMVAAKRFAALPCTQIVEIYRETLVERVKIEF